MGRSHSQFVEEVGFGNWGSLWLSYREPDLLEAVALKVVHRSKDTASAARVKALWNEYKQALLPFAFRSRVRSADVEGEEPKGA